MDRNASNSWEKPEGTRVDDNMADPDRIAETYVHLAKQHRSTWTHELDLRAFSDRPWWNH